jgi:hypothetical protein
MPLLRRLVYGLALLPIVPATATIAAESCATWFGSSTFDDLRWFNLFAALLWVGCSVVIWRAVVIWTLGRGALTALVGLIPFCQAIYGQPLWNSGCVTDEILRLGQGELGVGLWIWLAIWVWWGWERTRGYSDGTPRTERRPRMTPRAKRIVASMGTIPFAVGVFFVAGIMLVDLVGLTDRPAVPLAFAAAALVTVTAWVLIWRKDVVWSGAAARRTALTTGLLMGVPICVTVFIPDVSSPWDTTLGCLPIIGWGVWIAVTVWIWPIRARALEAVVSSPKCQHCGYLLIGLRATRCPECGDEPTIDELWAATVESEF